MNQQSPEVQAAPAPEALEQDQAPAFTDVAAAPGDDRPAAPEVTPASEAPAKSNVELEGKFGEYGGYSLDLQPSGDVVGDVNASIEKTFFGFLTVKGGGDVKVTADLIGGVGVLAEKSGNSIVKKIAAIIAKFKKA